MNELSINIPGARIHADLEDEGKNSKGPAKLTYRHHEGGAVLVYRGFNKVEDINRRPPKAAYLAVTMIEDSPEMWWLDNDPNLAVEELKRYYEDREKLPFGDGR